MLPLGKWCAGVAVAFGILFSWGCSGMTGNPPAGSGPSPTPPVQQVQLTVTLAGGGTGRVTSSPAGINCGQTCSGNFNSGSTVTLTAAPATGFTFSGWSGACSGTGTCTVTVSNATAVTATFGATVQAINHIIFMAQENRSFDHYFGAMREYWAKNGFPDQAFDGLPQFNNPAGAAPSNRGCDPAFPYDPTATPPQTSDCVLDSSSPTITSYHLRTMCTENTSPFWNESHNDWNITNPVSGTATLDGFVWTSGHFARGNNFFDTDGKRVMGYYDGNDLNYYYFMASNFATSDRWFSPVMSRTQLNRMYLLAATSQGYAYPIGSSSSDSTQLTATTIFEALQNAGITWKIYVNADNTNCANMSGDAQSQCLLEGYSYLNEFSYEQTVLNSAGKTPDLLQNIVPVTQFTKDAQNGTLPQVALIEPPSTEGLDEHPSDSDAYPENIQTGAMYASGLINTLMTSPSWKDSAMILTYDEAGGFYDHVPPQPAAVPDQFASPIDLEPTDKCDGANATSGVCSFGMTGFRVPLIVISPFAKKNYVSHTVYDHTAILALIEKRFGLQPLTNRDKSQSDMSADFFDFTTIPWATPPTPPAQSTGGTCTVAAPTP